jgi:teichuronic acid biosynthesis glycosyltransferase TuaG
MSFPLVSIITPLYNGQKYIERAIVSVRNQTFSNWELLIVDDCSDDDSPVLVRNFTELDNRIKLFTLGRNGGAAVARNFGIRVASGRFIAFLDCDDEWMPDKLEKQLDLLSQTGASFCFGAYIRVNEAGSFLGSIGVPRLLSYNEALKTNYVGCLTAIYDTRILGKVFMPELMPCHEDYPVWLHIIKKSGVAVGVPTVLAKYCVRGSSLSSNKFKTVQQIWFTYRVLENLNFFSSIVCLVNQSVRALVRNNFPRFAILVGWLHVIENE